MTASSRNIQGTFREHDDTFKEHIRHTTTPSGRIQATGSHLRGAFRKHSV
jgi:hypothetical protein